MNNSTSTLLIVIGISGDLSRRFLLPALAEVSAANQLPDNFKVLGISRRELSVTDIFTSPTLEQLSQKVHAAMHTMNLDDPADYPTLSEKIRTYNAEQIIFYFAVPPESVQPIVTNLGTAGLNQPNVKLLLEKPFGNGLESATSVIDGVEKYFQAEQTYRIDHYLAKEMAQNITVFLGGNSLLRSLWSNKFIESIDIIVAEELGIEGRTNFYDKTGALRDIVQSHALQLLALTILEPCSSVFEFSELPARRLAALKQLKVSDDPVIRAQYAGYKEEVKNPISTTETFVSLGLESTDPNWQGVKLGIITGKNLASKSTEINVRFKTTNESEANNLIIRIQPKEGIEIDLWVKQPGYDRKLQKLKLGFDYEKHFDRIPDAYERVLVDAINSKQHLFASSSEILAEWNIIQPILDTWCKESPDTMKIYESGSEYSEVLSG